MRLRARSVITLSVAIVLVGCAGSGSTSSRPTTSATSPSSTLNTSADDLATGPSTVTGRVGRSEDYPAVPHLVEPSDDYYLGMAIISEHTVIRGLDGIELTVDDLRDGDRIALWITSGCAESFPVQCDVALIETTG